MTCKYCKQGMKLQHGVHLGEVEMHRCTRTELTLEPMTKGPKVRDTWHQPEKRKDLPFVTEGGV